MRESRFSDERWRRLSPQLDHALELSGEQRGAWLASLHEEDAALANDVEALLADHVALQERGFLDGDAVGPAAASLAGQHAGAYTLRSLLGQGGMGSVWLAERSDGRFTGAAAVKLLNASLLGREGEERFRREGSILARLRHPHIAHLIDAGVSPFGQPYLVLEHVDGERIDAYCDARQLPIEARLRLFLDVLAAVAHAHANLVVHRDIKPSNVLVTKEGEVKLLDFGIAKLLEPEGGGDPATALTREGAAVLTPEYAAPEQLTGAPITTATDIYALGTLLYVLLGGRHPTAAATPAALLQAIVEAEPQRLSAAATDTKTLSEKEVTEVATRRGTTPERLRRQLRGDLETVVAKALKKRPEERYPAAEALADDIRRYLGHLPVRARPDSLRYRARKFVARNRLPVAAAAVAALALLAGAAVAAWEARSAARERDRALVQLQRAEATNDLSSFLLSEATPSAGRPITNAELLARGERLIDQRFAADPVLRVHMLLTLADRYHENQQFDDWERVLSRAFALSRTIDDRALRSRAACARAISLAEQGAAGAASALLVSALADLAKLPAADWDEARCRVAESTAARLDGDLPRAIAAGERALALEEGRRGPAGREYEALAALAAAYGRSDFAAADRVYRRLDALLAAQGRDHTRDAAAILNNWSAMLQNAGRYLPAIPLSERAIRVAREQDSENGASLTQLVTYGNALIVVGRAHEAIPVIEESLAKARQAGSARRVIGVLRPLAEAHDEVGDREEAGKLLREAQALLADDPAPTTGLAGALERNLAKHALARGEPREALRFAQGALARYEAAQSPHEILLASLLVAEAHNELAEFAPAERAAQRALTIDGERLGDLHSYNGGQAHLELGIAQAGGGQLSSARRELQQAVSDLRSSVGENGPATLRAVAALARLDGRAAAPATGR